MGLPQNYLCILLLVRRRAGKARATMTPHRLRRAALHLPARRSRQNAHAILRQTLSALREHPEWAVRCALGHFRPGMMPEGPASVCARRILCKLRPSKYSVTW